MRKISLSVLFLIVLVLTMLLASIATAQTSEIEVVASGLNNPRGLEFGPEGKLYVAEAGTGGSGPCGPGPEGERCYGESSSIARIDLATGNVERVVTGLPSLAVATDSSFALGAVDISFQGRGNGFITIGFGGNPADREAQFGLGGAKLAQLARTVASGNWKNIVDLGDYEDENNPTGDEEDSNPYDVLALPGKQIVVDAGANDLLEVSKNGDVRPLAVFPNRMVDAPPFLGLPPGTQIPMDAVPTSVALGPDGAYYVGQLTGFPFPVGGANVYRVPAEGGEAVVYASGFTNIIEVAFGSDGNLYVLEIAKNGLLAAFGGGDWTGALIRVEADGTQTEIASEGLFAPGGMTFGPDGAIYVTNNSIFAGIGEVVKIQP